MSRVAGRFVNFGDRVAQRPEAVSDDRYHGWGYAKRFVDTGQGAEQELQRQRECGFPASRRMGSLGE